MQTKSESVTGDYCPFHLGADICCAGSIGLLRGSCWFGSYYCFQPARLQYECWVQSQPAVPPQFLPLSPTLKPWGSAPELPPSAPGSQHCLGRSCSGLGGTGLCSSTVLSAVQEWEDRECIRTELMLCCAQVGLRKASVQQSCVSMTGLVCSLGWSPMRQVIPKLFFITFSIGGE